MDKGKVAFEIALACKYLALHLARCRKCRRGLRHHKPRSMCEYGHEHVDEILKYIGKYDDDWKYLEFTLDRIM